MDLAAAPDGSVVLMTYVGDLRGGPRRRVRSPRSRSATPASGSGLTTSGDLCRHERRGAHGLGPPRRRRHQHALRVHDSPGQFMTIDVSASGALYVLHDGTTARSSSCPEHRPISRSPAAATRRRSPGPHPLDRRWDLQLPGRGVHRRRCHVVERGGGGPDDDHVRVVGRGHVVPVPCRRLQQRGVRPHVGRRRSGQVPGAPDLDLLPPGLEVSDSTPTPSQSLTIEASGFVPLPVGRGRAAVDADLDRNVQADGGGVVHATVTRAAGLGCR